MNPKALRHLVTFLFSLALPMVAQAGTPAVIQNTLSSSPSGPITQTLRAASAGGSISIAQPLVAISAAGPSIVQSTVAAGPSAPLTLTLTTAPKPGNMIFAAIGFAYYGDRNFNAPDSSWTCALGSGGNIHINTCSHVVVAGEGTSYTFIPTSTDGPGVQGILFEASGVVSAQIAYTYTGDTPGTPGALPTPPLTPAVLGMIPVAVDFGGLNPSVNQPGWSTMQTSIFMTASVANTLTADTTTPISTTFNYSNAGALSLQETILLVPGAFASAPVASVGGGSYATTQSIVLSAPLPGSVIHYTLDGTNPTCASTVYSAPITITTTTTLSYLACTPGYANSAIQTATYIVGSGTLTGISLGPMGDLHGYVPFAGDAFHQDMSAVPVDSNSANILAGIGANHLHHDWSSVGGGNYGIPYVVVDSSVTPLVPFINQEYSDESDLTLYPIPDGMPIESTPPTCTVTGDNHAIILDKATGVDYEFYRAQHCPGSTPQWQAVNGVLWDMTTIQKRPYGYTSVDAAGLSVFEGLVRYDEVAAGVINHAIRFTTAQTRCDHYTRGDPIGAYVLPATHAACNNSGTLNVMGMRLRLKASFDVSSYSRVNQIILTAMKKYGLILADNGSSMYIQGTPDARWNDDDLTALERIGSTDFEVLQMPQIFTNESHPTGTAPVINALAAASPTVIAGQSVTLAAAVNGASYSYIDNAGFLRNASMTVTPKQTTTYTLTSRNAFGSTSMATTVTVLPAAYKDPGLAFVPVAAQTLGGAPITVSAASLSSGQITYSLVSGPASITGNTVTLTGVGMVVLQASQVSAGIYIAATATVSFAVNGIDPHLVFSAIADQMYGALPFPVSAQSNSSSAIFYSVVSGPAMVVGNVVTVTGAGVVTLQAGQAAAGRYTAGVAQASFTVKPIAPTLAFSSILPKVYGAAPFALSSVSNSAGGNTYSVLSGSATIDGNIVTITGAGTVNLMVSQSAAGNYTAGTATTRLKVLQADPQLTFAPIAAQTYGASPFALNVKTASTGSVTYTVTGPATISGNVLSMNGAGTLTISASQAATTNYVAAAAVTTVVIDKQTPSVMLQLSTSNVLLLNPVLFGTRIAVSGRANPVGTATVIDNGKAIGIYPVLSLLAGTVSGILPTNLAIGVHSLTVMYSGDTNYTSSVSAPVVLTVRPRLVGISPTL